jgi:hypothetical protein
LKEEDEKMEKADKHFIVREVKSQEEKEKLSLIAESRGNIFNTLKWLQIFGVNIRILGIYSSNDKLIGGFALYEQKKWGITFYRDAPYTPYMGPFVSLEAQNPVYRRSALKEILTAVAEYLDSFKFSLICLSLNRDIIDTQPFIWRKFKVNPRYTYIIDLTQPWDEILKNMSKERRKKISKALRDGIKVEKVCELDIIKNLAGKTYKKQGKSIPYEMFLNKILFEFADETNSFAFVSFLDERPIAGIFCVHDKEIAYFLVSGYDYEINHPGAGALAHLEAIKYAKEIGLKYLDFEGSMVPQIEFFFREFGGDLVPVFRVSKANILLEFILKFIKREIF